MLPGIRLSLGNSAASQRAVAVSDIHQDPRTKQKRLSCPSMETKGPPRGLSKKQLASLRFSKCLEQSTASCLGLALVILLGAPGEETAGTSHGSRSASIAL